MDNQLEKEVTAMLRPVINRPNVERTPDLTSQPIERTPDLTPPTQLTPPPDITYPENSVPTGPPITRAILDRLVQAGMFTGGAVASIPSLIAKIDAKPTIKEVL